MNKPFDPTKFDPRIYDFEFYAANLLKIKTYYHPHSPNASTNQVERIIPLILNPIQRRLHAEFERQLKQRGYVRIDVLKARREGVSTYVEGRGFHKCVTSPNTHGFIIAHDLDSLNTIFSMSKLFYDELPPYYRPMLRYSSKKELVFENPNSKERFTNPGLRSRIEVFSAKKVTASRAGGYSWAHLSEVAFWPEPEKLCPSIVPSVPDLPGTFIIRESTANGRGNYWHEEWLADKEGDSNFTPLFFSWLEFPHYSRPWDSPDEEHELLSTLDEEEEMLLKKYKATTLQLHWRRHKILDLQGDVELFHQEYPVDDVEAFIASGICYFNRDKLRHLLNLCTPPTFVGDITPYGPVSNDDGPLFIWEPPQKGEDYVIGVDPKAGSSDSGDAAVMEVLKVPKDSPIVEQVAEWRGFVDPVVLAGKAIALARYYNDALLSPEINAGGGGLTCLNEIKESYYNIYRWQYFDRFAKYMTQKIGWETNITTKPLLCDYCSACLNADLLVIRSEGLIDEMMSFIRRPTGGGEADSGCYDDRVMAFMIALFTLAHSYRSASLLSELAKSNVKPKEEDEQKPTAVSYVDHDISLPSPLFSSLPWSDSSYSWLNY
jgi:hypothetical protein